MELLKLLPTRVRLVYTDGSKQSDSVGWSYVERYLRASVPAVVKPGRLGRAEVVDAEVVAIHQAVKRLARGRPAPAVVYSDCVAAVEACRFRATPSLQTEVLEV